MSAAAVIGGVLTLARLLCFARGVRKCIVVRESPLISLIRRYRVLYRSRVAVANNFTCLSKQR